MINLNIQTADFSWSPDGKEITYSWNYGIFKINIDSGKVERLTSNKNNSDMAPMWSKDGKIYYNESTDTHKLVLRKMDPDGSKNEVVSVIDWDTTKGFSPQKILFAPQK